MGPTVYILAIPPAHGFRNSSLHHRSALRINTLRKGDEMLIKCAYQDYSSTTDHIGAHLMNLCCFFSYLKVFACSAKKTVRKLREVNAYNKPSSPKLMRGEKINNKNENQCHQEHVSLYRKACECFNCRIAVGSEQVSCRSSLVFLFVPV